MVDPEQLDDFLRLNHEEGLAPFEALEVIQKLSTVKQIHDRRRLRAEAQKWIGVPMEDWPPFDPEWDLDQTNFHMALDGDSAASFDAYYERVGPWMADVEEISRSLHYGAQRTLPPWDDAYASKTARLVAWWSGGGKVTPPLVMPCEDQICFAGGNHRFAVARAKGASSIPILIEAHSVDFVRRRLPGVRPITI